MTAAAINQLSILYNMRGQEYTEDFKRRADNERRVLLGQQAQETGKLSSVETYITAFEQQGWTQRITGETSITFDFTPAGEQAILLLTKVPDHLKFFPYFIAEIIARYKQDNPAQGRKNPGSTDIFPYWTFYKIIRECNDYLSEDEFRRFLVKMENRNQITQTIEDIHKYRDDLDNHIQLQEIDQKYGGANNETKARPLYFMHRAGEGLGKVGNFNYGIIETDGRCPLGTTKYILNESYCEFVDYILDNEPPGLPNDLSRNDWFSYYGAPIVSSLDSEVEDDDIIWININRLVEKGSSGIILSGPPGTSKTWYAKQLALKLTDGDESHIESIQFHPSYSYEDFVEGFVPSTSTHEANFIVKKKIFTQMCDKASLNPNHRYVLIIDEFNRGDISKILGELMTYLETEYRGIPFRLPYSEEEIIIPRNLILIGTMNPYDKSVTEFDIALTRRFDVYEMLPDSNLLRKILTRNKMEEQLQEDLVKFFIEIQDIFEVGLGHAFFKNSKDKKDLNDVWKYQLEPLFKKEFKYEDDIMEKIINIYPWSEED